MVFYIIRAPFPLTKYEHSARCGEKLGRHRSRRSPTDRHRGSCRSSTRAKSRSAESWAFGCVFGTEVSERCRACFWGVVLRCCATCEFCMRLRSSRFVGDVAERRIPRTSKQHNVGTAYTFYAFRPIWLQFLGPSSMTWRS